MGADVLYNDKRIGGLGLKDLVVEADTGILGTIMDMINMGKELNIWVYRIIKEWIRYNQEQGRIVIKE